MGTEQLETDIVALAAEQAEAQTTLAAAKTDLADFVAQAATAQETLTAIEAKIFEETRRLTAFKDELDELDRAVKAKRQETADCELKRKVLEQDIDRIKKEQKSAVDAVAKLEKQYTWISDEHQ